MTAGAARRASGLVALSLVCVALRAHAVDSDNAPGEAEMQVRTAMADAASIQETLDKVRRQLPTPEKRIAAAELLMRTGDYDRAILEFNKVIELARQGEVNETSYADALFLLGETYFKDGQYLSAARDYREIVDKGARRPYTAHAGRAIGRLVDVALRAQRLDMIDYIFARMNELPTTDISGSLQYARGKAYYARGDWAAARAALVSVPPDSEYLHQAHYLLGVVTMKEAMAAATPSAGQTAAPKAKFAAAIDQFRLTTRLKPDTDEHRHVIELAWMAVGRLLYESELFLDAADAYSHVDRSSPEFSEALFELAWVYVRLGDFVRARRALEVLSVTAPETMHFADGSLLRADIMLRSGLFDRALALYQSVREQYDPMRTQVDAFLTANTEPTVYYDRLVESELQIAHKDALPALVIDWVREAAEDDRAFAVIDEVARSRNLIKESISLARKLRAVLATETRVKAFPELKAGLERATSLLNRVALARRTVALGLEDVDDSSLGGEIGQVRAQRRAVMRRLRWLPVTDDDFMRREISGERQWNGVSQRLQQLTLEADRLQAVINGLKRVLAEADKFHVRQDPATRSRFLAEIAANERDLSLYRDKIAGYREAIDIGKAEIGFGDQRYMNDAQLRADFKRLLAREIELAAAGRAGEDNAEYARSVQPVLKRADAAEARLEGMKSEIDREVRGRSHELQNMVNQEAENIERYAVALDDLDETARVVVGEVAMKNFGVVRDRLKSIVLRADIGIVQQAWEIREEQMARVHELQRDRAREDQNLNDELREVLDDAGGEDTGGHP